MRLLRKKSAALVVMAVLMVGASGQDVAKPAAGNQSGQQEFTFKSTSDTVLVNVVVRDKRGNLVRGLKQEDFTLLEDGKQQHVSAFDFEQIDMAVTSAEPTVVPEAKEKAVATKAQPLAPLNTTKLDSNNKRLIVLFFDFTGMEVEEVNRSVDSAQKYVSSQMQPADLVAVISFSSSLRVEQDFTSDKIALQKTLTRFGGTSGAGYSAGTTGDSDGTPDTGTAFNADDSDFNTFNADRKLQAMQALSDALAKIQQKKSVIYFSGGLQQNGIENQSQLRATINSAIRGNVVIYSVDAPGLQAMVPGGTAETASVRGTGAFTGASMRSAYDANFGATETLSTLAKDTGGKAFLDTNDFGGVFTQVQQDTSAYYVLSYRSSNLLKDGRYRKITVKTGLKDVKLEYRTGYYAPRDFAHFKKEDREEQMQTELNSDLPATDFPVFLAAAYFRLSDDRYFVPVSLVVPGSEIPFVDAANQDKASLDVIGSVRVADTKFPIANVRETVKLALDKTQNVSRKNVQYNTGFILAPGEYHVKLVVRENQTGKLASFETDLNIPDLRKQQQKKGVRMSSVVLSAQMKPATKSQKDNPLSRNGQELIPNISHVFTPDQHLYVYYEVYDPEKAKVEGNADAGAPKVKNPVRVISSVEFLRDDVKTFETPVLEVRELSSERKAAVFQIDVPLQKLRPGYYMCQLNIVDDTSGTFIFPRFPILIKPEAIAAAKP
ncbi:MAG: VWFA-related protein [Acidobacteriales bacterium]|nr:VWFA-related protein [Terriglobales bacterium]